MALPKKGLLALVLKKADEETEDNKDDLRVAARDLKKALSGDSEDAIVEALQAFQDLSQSPRGDAE